MKKKTPKRPVKTPESKKPAKEVWKSNACSEGRCKECRGKIVFIPGDCECECHRKETPGVKFTEKD